MIDETLWAWNVVKLSPVGMGVLKLSPSDLEGRKTYPGMIRLFTFHIEDPWFGNE